MLKYITNKDVLHIIGVNTVALGITVADIEETLKIAAMVVALCYSIWRWIIDYKKYKTKKNDDI